MLRPKEVVQLWVDAFNKHDVEAITTLYHENATNHQVANEPVVGIEAIPYHVHSRIFNIGYDSYRRKYF